MTPGLALRWHEKLQSPFEEAALGGLLVGMVVGLSGAYASEWSMLSM